jgi:hypothetical protein
MSERPADLLQMSILDPDSEMKEQHQSVLPHIGQGQALDTSFSRINLPPSLLAKLEKFHCFLCSIN